ncbi:flagellar hook-length control protein FliK [Aliiroseovarius sp.]|uniref:flagellar hook-length control protein FliK n=1 Tax=Aliiroseovarius sp. TaxID=1872442 RepID=UPI0026098956|nr:flagellar hook-length control protein FliK [Aliiroseovarius sp.]
MQIATPIFARPAPDNSGGGSFSMPALEGAEGETSFLSIMVMRPGVPQSVGQGREADLSGSVSTPPGLLPSTLSGAPEVGDAPVGVDGDYPSAVLADGAAAIYPDDIETKGKITSPELLKSATAEPPVFAPKSKAPAAESPVEGAAKAEDIRRLTQASSAESRGPELEPVSTSGRRRPNPIERPDALAVPGLAEADTVPVSDIEPISNQRVSSAPRPVIRGVDAPSFPAAEPSGAAATPVPDLPQDPSSIDPGLRPLAGASATERPPLETLSVKTPDQAPDPLLPAQVPESRRQDPAPPAETTFPTRQNAPVAPESSDLARVFEPPTGKELQVSGNGYINPGIAAERAPPGLSQDVELQPVRPSFEATPRASLLEEMRASRNDTAPFGRPGATDQPTSLPLPGFPVSGKPDGAFFPPQDMRAGPGIQASAAAPPVPAVAPAEYAPQPSPRVPGDFWGYSTPTTPTERSFPAPDMGRPVHEAAVTPQSATPLAASSLPVTAQVVVAAGQVFDMGKQHTREGEAVELAPLAIRGMELPSARIEALVPRADLSRHLAQQVADVARMMPDRPVELTLSPEELGRLRLTFTVDGGTMAVAVNAERPETMDLLRRNIDALAQELREIGYDEVNFDFTQGGNARGGNDDGASSAQFSGSDEGARSSASEPPPDPARLTLGPTGGIDIRL